MRRLIVSLSVEFGKDEPDEPDLTPNGSGSTHERRPEIDLAPPPLGFHRAEEKP